MQFEPELPEEADEELEEEEEAEEMEEAEPQEEEAADNAVLGEGEADGATKSSPTGAKPRGRPPTWRSRFWDEGADPLSKGLPYTGRPL